MAVYTDLQEAVNDASAGETITVKKDGLSATVDPNKGIIFDRNGFTPTLTTSDGTKVEISEDGSISVPDTPVVNPDPETYTVTINGTVQDKEYKEGDTVSIYAPVYSNGRVFDRWVVVSGNAVIANAYSNQTTFVMPEGDVEIVAVYSSYVPVYPEIPEYVPDFGGSSETEPTEPETEWRRENGETYYYKDGKMVKGWVEEDGIWYWMDEETGAMTTEEWVKVDNVWYAFDDAGHMLTGWQEIDGKWYFLKDWGGMATGWQFIDGDWYFLKGDGSMATGWLLFNGQWYFLKGNGAMATGWVEWNGKWYFLYDSGEMATNATIGGYYVNSNGEWVE